MTYAIEEAVNHMPSGWYRGFLVIDAASGDAVSQIFRTRREALKYIQQLYKQGEENEV